MRLINLLKLWGGRVRRNPFPWLIDFAFCLVFLLSLIWIYCHL